MMRCVGGGILVGVAWVACGLAWADGARVLDKPAMSATPSELLAVAQGATPSDEPVAILREQHDVSFDDRGRATAHTRWVFVVRTQAGIDAWSTISAGWAPAYQDRPVLQARVVDPAGRVASLDPAPVTDAAANPTELRAHALFTASLPALRIGSVVEEDIAITDREPALSTGGVAGFALGSGPPTASTVIDLSAPAARKAHHVERQLPRDAKVSHRIADGRDHWRVELGPLPGWSTAAAGTEPYVGIATAPSWTAVAAAYRALVDQRLAGEPFASPPELPRTPSLETVKAIDAWIRRRVQAPHVDAFGLPAPPASTVARGTGSSADRAALWIALLRQAGLPGELALTATGRRARLDPDLPGIEPFDGVLVRTRVGRREIWIDPGAELVRPGELAAEHRDVRALVIAGGTRALITTPAAVPADNTVREVRTYVAAEAGASRVTEVTRETGAFEADRRAWYHATPAAAAARQLTDYASAEYAGALDGSSTTTVDDLATPFEVKLAVKDARRVYTRPEYVDVVLYPGAALAQLPPAVSHPTEPPGTAGFVWRTPHIYEIENRIIAPIGYQLPAPAPDRTRSIGTASFTEHQAVEGQTLIVTFRFDTGKVRLTAAELAALQADVAKLRAEELHPKIELTGAALAGAKQPREAIAELRRLIQLHPTEAIHHTQLSAILLGAGAGEAARREARTAVALEPKSVDALVGLGQTLMFDTVGRMYGFDWDRAGALAALQQARKLDPRHVDAAVELRDVALHNQRGRAFEDGADLHLALDAARAALALDKTDAHTLAVVRIQSWLGQSAEAATLAETVSAAQPEREWWIVANLALTRGPAAAIQKAGSLRPGNDGARLIDAAAKILRAQRRYEQASALRAEVVARTGGPGAAAESPLTRHDDVATLTKDPRTAALGVILRCNDPDRVLQVFWSPELERVYRRACPANESRRESTPGRMLSDILQSTVQLTVEGDGDAWRVATTPDARSVIYLALDHGSAKAFGGPSWSAGIGDRLARWLDGGRDDLARRVVSWLARDADPSTSLGGMMRRRWGPGLPTDRDQLRRVAAMLLADSDPDRAITLAGRCASPIKDVAQACHETAVLAASRGHRWSDVEAQYALIPGASTISWAWPSHVSALVKLTRFDEADRVLDDLLAADPDNADAAYARIEVALGRGRPDEAIRRGDALVNAARPRAADLNGVAWLRMIEHRELDVALDLARRAAHLSASNVEMMNTVAAIEAERGELAAAIADSARALSVYPKDPPGDTAWYVAGRIDEQLGLTDDAIAAYRRVKPRDVAWGDPHELAARRLTALHATP